MNVNTVAHETTHITFQLYTHFKSVTCVKLVLKTAIDGTLEDVSQQTSRTDHHASEHKLSSLSREERIEGVEVENQHEPLQLRHHGRPVDVAEAHGQSAALHLEDLNTTGYG